MVGEVFQFGLEPTPLADVLEQRDLVGRCTGVVPNQRHRQVGPDDAAILPEESFLDAEVIALPGDQLVVGLPDARRVLGMDHLADIAPGELVGGVPEHLQQ
jgi:hypothetical protein